MKSLKANLETLQKSRFGLFLKKLMDDQVPNLAALLAWGTLSTLLPLMLGMLTVAGMVLTDPARLDQIYNTILVAVPPEVSSVIGDALEGIRTSAAPAGVIALVLLLFNGSSFFANMASVFDRIHRVASRNVIMQRVVSIVMLILATVLLVLSTFSLGLGSLLSNLPLGADLSPVLTQVVTWSVSIVSAFVLFVLLYRVLPNARLGWRDVLPGALLSTVLFFVILAVFPLYVRLFPPNQAYALFGVFLVFTFWLYLLGFVFALGAELNAFLRQPVPTEASAASAPCGVEQLPPGRVGPSVGGRLLGLIGLLVAVMLLRKRSIPAA
jgi:membrane protein